MPGAHAPVARTPASPRTTRIARGWILIAAATPVARPARRSPSEINTRSRAIRNQSRRFTWPWFSEFHTPTDGNESNQTVATGSGTDHRSTARPVDRRTAGSRDHSIRRVTNQSNALPTTNTCSTTWTSTKVSGRKTNEAIGGYVEPRP